MKLLALDTSTDACSVALARGEHIDERHVVAPREHTRLLIPTIEELLTANDTTLDELDAIVLGNGPGSFIGMRIGASVAQGLAFGVGVDIVPISSLAAIAAHVFAETNASSVVVTQDARMDQVYLGQYRRGTDQLPVGIGVVRLHDVAEPIAVGDDDAVVAAGGGWSRYPELSTTGARVPDRFDAARHPRARFLIQSGKERLADGKSVSPDELIPDYVRREVAKAPDPAGGRT